MTGQPGDGCQDGCATHPHWCGFCGAYLMFTDVQCGLLVIVPPCPRCGEKQWRNEVDELIAPDFRETP